MLTPEFENSSYAADYDPDWRKKSMNNKTETIAYFGQPEPLNLEHMKKVNDKLTKDWDAKNRKAWNELLADLAHPKHTIWHGIIDPPSLAEPHCVSVFIPSITTTGARDTTTAADWTVKSTRTVPEQEKPCEKFVDADDLEIKMLENELAEIENTILLKKSEARHRRIKDLKGKIAEAKMHLQNLE